MEQYDKNKAGVEHSQVHTSSSRASFMWLSAVPNQSILMMLLSKQPIQTDFNLKIHVSVCDWDTKILMGSCGLVLIISSI
jgi:hypothetical protein